ncbi:MAG TPA: glycoside hydrolase family 9 protein [Chitinophagaceae bacterium]|nr:glycoside hydrolase family 9 protein [Chitinophagaceae bacterium]
MMKPHAILLLLLLMVTGLLVTSHRKSNNNTGNAYIRINLLGYKPNGIKVAVWCSKESNAIVDFQLVEVLSGKIVFKGKAGKPFGAYGPFAQTYRLNFSEYTGSGRYLLQAGDAVSPEFTIGADVYAGAADFCLRYMRQQRSGFNPFLKDSCHTYDGYTMYGPMPDSTHIDVSGGWHDASDYLQYSTTSANATYHLLAAYRDFKNVFSDKHVANGLPGRNGIADVLDEAKWGLDWLLKMHPRPDWMFNQLADDRDHRGMRIPKEDSFYGKGFERPVYFCTGEPQGLFKYKNRATGTASTAGKFSSAFALGNRLFASIDKAYAEVLYGKAHTAYEFGRKKPGVCQTAPGRAPYFYEEDNWMDDMELAAVNLHLIIKPAVAKKTRDKYLAEGRRYAQGEPITPWLGADTARHYQWYPFINLGHYELARASHSPATATETGYYKTGIEKVWQKAMGNAFYRGIPFIWCSNNLTTSFAIQCYWYRTLSKDQSYLELEQANFDWLFGCNPWGTSFVYGLPSWGDTPVDPHSAFTHLKKYPIDGGLVDGPVYGSIYGKLIGITLYQPDEYAEFQSDLVVYHDDYGDYSTNEPTMDGTASLIYLLAAKEAEQPVAVKKKR